MPVTKGKPSASKKTTRVPAVKAKPSSAGGRNKFIPTKDQRDMVTAMAGFGMPYERIALLITNPHTGKPLSVNTLKLAFADELDAAEAKVEAMIVGSLLKHALGNGKGAVTAGIYLTKAKFGYRDRTETIKADVDLPEGKVSFTMNMDG